MSDLQRVMRWQKPNAYVSVEEGATKGATIGVNLFYNGFLVALEDILNPITPDTPGTTVTAWSLIIDIPANVTALANQAGTGIYVLTAPGTSATRQVTSADSSVTITNPGGVAGDIDLSVAVSGGGILPMVTGEVYADQPRLMYFDDGSLFYVQVE